MRLNKSLMSMFLGSILVSSAHSAPRVCGLKSGDSLINYADSTGEISRNVSPVIANGLEDLYSFPDIKNLIQAVGAKKTCVTAIAVGKNIYQYDEILAVLELQDAAGKTSVTPLLLQTASIQAHENLGSKPWLGFGRGEFVKLVQSSLADARFQEAGTPAGESFSPIDLISSLFSPAQKVDATSTSYVHLPDVDPEWSTYWVSRLKVMDTGNPFTSQYLTDVSVVQIQESTGRVRTASVPGFFELHTRMASLQDADAPSNMTESGRLTQLRQLSAN